MVANEKDAGQVDELLDTPNLAEALETDRFKQFLDHIPIAIGVSELRPSERIVYANIEFERLTGQTSADMEGKGWETLPGSATIPDGEQLSEAITASQDYVGCFTITWPDGSSSVDVWSNIIEDDDGAPVFRLVALAEAGRGDGPDRAEFEARIRDKDMLLRELQHRVKNNLQMITALIRLEARNTAGEMAGDRFDRLAGRIESLSLLYRALSDDDGGETIDLGIYLSEIASAVMRAHAVEGIHLDMSVDTWPVSINVAMPTGLVVNELLTNALKHAFADREGGTITLHSVVNEEGCRITVADDGIGLKEGTEWPQPGKLGTLMVRSLRQNAHALVDVVSNPGEGMRVTISFARSDAAPSGDE